MRVLPVVNVNVNQGILEMTRKNEGVLPPQPVPVGGPLCQFVEGWKHITNDPYVLSIVAKGYKFPFTSLHLLRQIDSMGNTISRRVTKDSGNARANFPYAS